MMFSTAKAYISVVHQNVAFGGRLKILPAVFSLFAWDVKKLNDLYFKTRENPALIALTIVLGHVMVLKHE